MIMRVASVKWILMHNYVNNNSKRIIVQIWDKFLLIACVTYDTFVSRSCGIPGSAREKIRYLAWLLDWIYYLIYFYKKLS